MDSCEPRTRPGPTLSALLSQPEMQQAQVLAGAESLHRQLGWVNFIEVFDDFAKVQPGDFVMTTAFAWEKYCGDGGGVIDALLTRGAVALAFQEDIYQAAIPPKLLSEAAGRGFTLLRLPKSFTFRQVSHALVMAGSDGRTRDIPEPVADESRVHLSTDPAGMEQLLSALHTQVRDSAWFQGWQMTATSQPDWPMIEATLQAYFANGCNLNQTAGNLSVHRHTVRNRLHQFSRLSGLNLSDHRQRLLLQLALLPA